MMMVVMSVDYHANYDDDDHDHNDDDDCQVIAWTRTRTTQKWNYTPAVELSGRLNNIILIPTVMSHPLKNYH